MGTVTAWFVFNERKTMEIKIYRHVIEQFILELQKNYPKKMFGYFLSDNDENIASSFYIFDSDDRQKKEISDKFIKLGKYYENNANAGFVSSLEETFRFEQYVVKNHLKKIGVFHVHLRHPSIFSIVDKDLHPSPTLWHLIISMRNIYKPSFSVFEVTKDWFRERELVVIESSDNQASSFNEKTEFYFVDTFLKSIDRQSQKTQFSILSELLSKTGLPHEVTVKLLTYCKNHSESDIQRIYSKWKELNKVEVDLNYSKVSKDRMISTIPITNSQYKQVFPEHIFDSEYKDFPVVNVSWYSAKLFSEVTDTTLLTEKIWNKYCDDKVGINFREHYNPELMKVAVYSENSNNRLHEAGTRESNRFGLYDMQGNAWEWCESKKDSVAPTKGGSYLAFPEMCRPIISQFELKDFFAKDLTFRVMKEG